MDSCRPSLLCNPGDTHLHISRSGLHEISQFIDNHHNVGETVGDLFFLFPVSIHRPQFPILQRRCNRLNLLLIDDFLFLFLFTVLLRCIKSVFPLVAHPVVEGIKVPNAFFGEDLVAPLHFIDAPLERTHHLTRISNDRHHEVRKS